MADSSIRRGNLNALCMSLAWINRRAKRLGSPSELINRLGGSSSFWSDRLTDRRLRGAKVVREIEEVLNLLKYSLKGDEEHGDFVQIPRISTSTNEEPDASNAHVAELGLLQFRRDFLRSVGVSAVNPAPVHVTGANMERTFWGGIVVVVNHADRISHTGYIHVFAWEGRMLVRRFQRMRDA